MIEYEIVLQEFKKNINNFDLNDININMKISHSYHVADLCGKLAKRLNLEENQIILAKVIGLLHDIGRFFQYTKTNDYNDYKDKLDHAILGVEYLFKEKHIEDFKISQEYYKIIETSIYNHNKYSIDESLSEEEKLFAKIVRDADKIDILRQNACAPTNRKMTEKISASVEDSINKYQMVKISSECTDSNQVLIELAYIFDINFKESYELLKETDNLELYLSMIEVDKSIEPEFERVKKIFRDYLEERICD